MAATRINPRLLQSPAVVDGGHPSSESRFYLVLIRVAVAQICQSAGYFRGQDSALEALTDIATRYLRALGHSASTCANRHDRTQSNLSDVIFAIEDLASVQGFPGSAQANSVSLFSSAVIKSLMGYVKYGKEIPFAQPLPPRTIVSFCNGKSEHCQWHGEKISHLPKWLPAFPPAVVREEGKKKESERECKWGCLDDEMSGENKEMGFKIGNGSVGL